MVESTSLPQRKQLGILIVILVVLGLVLVATTIRGPFIIDEINYLVTAVGLSQGLHTVPGTEGLLPSKELFAFDPEAHRRIAVTTPVFSVAPSLYAPVAVPFVFLGWHGLVLLNILSFLLTGLLVFRLAQRLSAHPHAPWIALALVLMGGYGIEYAQGVWPHMLSVFLVTASVFFTASVWNGEGWKPAILGGLFIGLATGIREQNIILAACLGLTIFVYGRQKFASSFWYILGVGMPLSVAATIRYFRQGLWHPFPKFIAYADQVGQQAAGAASVDPLRTAWARFVDFSVSPESADPIVSLLYRRSLDSGAFLIDGVVKKALLQSSPWIALAFAGLIAVWIVPAWRKDQSRPVLKPLSLLIAAVILVFSMGGVGRTDGLAYNQRYFLEIVPLAALAIVVVLDRVVPHSGRMFAGVLGAAFLFSLTLMVPSRPLYETALLRVPVVLALLLVIAFNLLKGQRKSLGVSLLLGMCLGWSVLVHFFTDLPASRNRRERNAAVLSGLEKSIPGHAAIFTFGRWRDAAGALMLSRDVVILDAEADEGKDSGSLAGELRSKGRPIFILGNGLPVATMRSITGQDSLEFVLRLPIPLYRVLPREKNQE